MKKNPDISIKNWPDGIADSPHLGFGLLKNVEIDSFPGALRGGKKPVTAFHAAYSKTFTAATNDVCTAASPAPSTYTAVTLTTTNTLPAGLSTGTVYFVINLSPTTFKLATTLANARTGTAVDITDAGTGVHTVTTVDPGTIKHYANDPRTNTRFCIDSNGRVWFNDGSIYLLLNGNTLTNAAGNGLAVFRVSDGSATYLFAFRNALIDVVNVYGTTELEAPSWTSAWQTMNTGGGLANSHHAIVGQDNIIYYVDDRYVGSIAEVAGQVFAPANGATFTFSSQALDLPLGSLCYWLEQLGVNLLISVSNDDFIYPWDRTSDSYGLPLPIGEKGGNKMKNIGNVVYILAGTKGNIYWTQGTYVRPFKKIPEYLTNNVVTPTQSPVTWGGLAAAGGKLIVGVGAASGQSGVYMIDPNGVTTLDNYPSTGQANVTALYATNDFYEMGYAGGADMMDTSRYANLECVAQSKLYRMADRTTKDKLSEVHVQLAVALAGTVRIGYRRGTTGAFTTAATITTSTSYTSYDQVIGITDIENVQFQVEFDHGMDILEVDFFE